MRRITTSTKAANLYGAGKDGFKDGNLSLGVAPTDLNADWFNQLQEEVAQFIEGEGIVLDGAVLTQLAQAIKRRSASRPGVQGLVGTNNAGAPNTQFDFKADAVTVRNPTTGETKTIVSVATFTNNVLTAGSAANGRDQAGAFAASSWVHFYFIYNPTTGTTATLSSASASAPTLPAGYTSWAYIGAVYFSSGSVLAGGYFRGAWFTYKTSSVVVSGGTQVLRTAVSLASSIPPNALQFKSRIPLFSVTANGSGTYLSVVTLEVLTAFTAYEFGMGGTAGFNLNMFSYGGVTILPNVGQNINYFITLTAGTAPSVNIAIDGYSNPNGGE